MDKMDRREGEQMARLACRALEAKKAVDIKVIDIHGVSVMADYFIISTAGNPNQMQAMVDQVEETLEKAGHRIKHVEGDRGSSWILMDFGDVIVHIFDEENRLFYDLERIWRDGRAVDTRSFIDGE